MSLLKVMQTSTAKTPPGFMKALTIHQPYATLVWLLLKENETRGWATRYRGLIAIHAGMRKMKPGEYTPEMVQALVPHFVSRSLDTEFDIWPYGAIVGVFRLTDCLPSWKYFKEIASTPFERHCGNYGEGRFVWRLEPIIQFKAPVPMKGAQGFWHVPENAMPEWLAHKEKAIA